ncbi:MAG: hypothetical protein HQK49_16375 [Oligoflexia bacterium]|nr:hypothetical protein [Oligoflexia bacterium]
MYAVFSLKQSSLLKYEKHIRSSEDAENIKRVYGIDVLPSDTQMRSILDEVGSEIFRHIFKMIFNKIQSNKGLKEYEVMINPSTYIF